MFRPYQYVGSAEIAEQANAAIDRLQPREPDDIRRWTKARVVECTYVVDTEGRLWLCDRHSEHVAFARGRPVLAADV
jgi:hypothetical protein